MLAFFSYVIFLGLRGSNFLCPRYCAALRGGLVCTEPGPALLLEHYGEVSMLDIKGADATKAVLVIGIMTLHSFGECSDVGVSFTSSKGNIPEGLAVSMVLASCGVSPYNVMLWSVTTSLPQPIVAIPAFLCVDASFYCFVRALLLDV